MPIDSGLVMAALILTVVLLAWHFQDAKSEKLTMRSGEAPAASCDADASVAMESTPLVGCSQDSSLTPDQLLEAQQGAMYPQQIPGAGFGYDAEAGRSAGTDVVQAHSGAPHMDYDQYLAAASIDDRVLENHRKWVDEVKPFSQTATLATVDDMDEAVYASLPRQGIFAFGRSSAQRAPAQNPATMWQHTEVDPALVDRHSTNFYSSQAV